MNCWLVRSKLFNAMADCKAATTMVELLLSPAATGILPAMAMFRPRTRTS